MTTHRVDLRPELRALAFAAIPRFRSLKGLPDHRRIGCLRWLATTANFSRLLQSIQNELQGSLLCLRSIRMRALDFELSKLRQVE